MLQNICDSGTYVNSLIYGNVANQRIEQRKNTFVVHNFINVYIVLNLTHRFSVWILLKQNKRFAPRVNFDHESKE